MADQDLRLTATAAGFDQAANEVKKVTDAEKQLGDLINQTADKTKLSGDSFRELQSILNNIHPRLGSLAAGFSKALDLAGEFGQSNVKLGGILGSVTQAIKANASALLLVGAGGAVVFGINSIISSIQRMGEESKKATEELKRQREALDEIFRGRAERQQTIESISDTRRSGGLSAESAARAAKSAESVSGQFRALDPEAVNIAAGHFGDAGLTNEQLAEAAFLIQTGRLKLDAGSSQRVNLRQLSRSANRFRPQSTDFFARETGQGQGTGTGGAGTVAAKTAAIEEIRSKEPGTLSIEDFIRNLPGGLVEGHDPKKLAEIVKGVADNRGLTLPAIHYPQNISNAVVDKFKGHSRGFAEFEVQSVLLEREGIEANPSEVRIAEFILQQLQKLGVFPGENFVGPPAPSGAAGNVTNHFYQQNMRITAPGAAARRAAVTNGHTRSIEF